MGLLCVRHMRTGVQVADGCAEGVGGVASVSYVNFKRGSLPQRIGRATMLYYEDGVIILDGPQVLHYN